MFFGFEPRRCSALRIGKLLLSITQATCLYPLIKFMNYRVTIASVLSAVLFLTGCASVRPAADSNYPPGKFLADCHRLGFAPTKYVLVVHIAPQKASLFADGVFVKIFSCSTSKFGIGEVQDSFCTPRGLHRVAEKIGGGEPAGTIFKERKIVGHVAELGVKAGGITTRIMWLDGLDPGFNSGGHRDTHTREIYIHGTGDQNSLGKPASHGCVHFADADLIVLYDLLPTGTLVWIAEK